MMEIRLKSTFLELLFVCLCLLTVFGPANGETVRVKEGSEAVLPCFIRPERDIRQDVFDWRKDGQKEVFFYVKGSHYNNGLTGQDEQFKGRVSHFPDQLQFSDASIRITDTKPSDSGNYSCDFSPDDFDRQRFNIELVVVACPEPHVTLLNQTKDWATLQCEVRGVSPNHKVEVKDSDGNILSAEETRTQSGSSYDIILKTFVTKTDKYHCVITEEEICHQVSEEIPVHFSGPPEVSGSNTGHVVAAVVVGVLLGVLLVVLVATNITRVKIVRKVHRRRKRKMKRETPMHQTSRNSNLGPQTETEMIRETPVN